MTPAERIIARFYAVNTFMYDGSNGEISKKEKMFKDIQKALNLEANLNYSVQQICETWQCLYSGFVKATKKMENKESLTYLENCLYNRLFFLRSFISSNDKLDKNTKKVEEAGKLLQKYKSKKNSKSSGSVSEEILNVMEETEIEENAVSYESAVMLNSIILSHLDVKVQRLYLNFILKSIKKFEMTCK